MASLQEIVTHTNELLAVSQFRDYCPNGLQVQGQREINRLIGGVTASQELIDAAIEQQADAILVHHGYFWKGEDAAITGMKYHRIRSLLDADIALLAYHLPLDAHHKLGNNAQLANKLGLTVEGGFASHGKVDIAMHGRLNQSMSATDLSAHIEKVLGRLPMVVDAGPASIQRIGWCTGAAQGYLAEAASLGLDAYISGEISEQTWHEARELGIHYFAAGHHATERFGVQALGQYLSQHFSLEFKFIDLDNPV